MKLFLFASLRGNNFKVTGNDVNDAWNKLCEREKDSGNMWKTSDPTRNICAVAFEGFTYIDVNNPSAGAYKEITAFEDGRKGVIILR